jgi:hypothetical protein
LELSIDIKVIFNVRVILIERLQIQIEIVEIIFMTIGMGSIEHKVVLYSAIRDAVLVDRVSRGIRLLIFLNLLFLI